MSVSISKIYFAFCHLWLLTKIPQQALPNVSLWLNFNRKENSPDFVPDRQLGRDPLHIHANQFQLHLQVFFSEDFRQTYHLQNLLWLGHSVSVSVVVSCNLIFMAGETTLKSLTLEAASIWRREETRVAGRLVQLNPTLQKDKVSDESESDRWVQLIRWNASLIAQMEVLFPTLQNRWF